METEDAIVKFSIAEVRLGCWSTSARVSARGRARTGEDKFDVTGVDLGYPEHECEGVCHSHCVFPHGKTELFHLVDVEREVAEVFPHRLGQSAVQWLCFRSAAAEIGADEAVVVCPVVQDRDDLVFWHVPELLDQQSPDGSGRGHDSLVDQSLAW